VDVASLHGLNDRVRQRVMQEAIPLWGRIGTSRRDSRGLR
jgi:hypothetical protein